MKLAFLAPLALVIGLAGCAGSGGISSSTVNPNYASAALSAFALVQSTATAYLNLPPCTGASTSICRNQSAAAQIIPLIRSARAAAAQVDTALHVSNGGPIDVTPYNTLNGLVTLLQSVYANYSISSPKGN